MTVSVAYHWAGALENSCKPENYEICNFRVIRMDSWSNPSTNSLIALQSRGHAPKNYASLICAGQKSMYAPMYRSTNQLQRTD